jgi:hypothetical protein
LNELRNLQVGGRVQFAALNAQINIAKQVLDPYIRNFEKVAVEIAKLALLWVYKEGDTLTAYRQKSAKRDVPTMQKGAKINISKKDFDPKTIIIQCELMSNQSQDDMQRINVFSQARQLDLPVPAGFIVEQMGWGQEEVLKADWLQEKIEKMALDNFQKQQDAELQLMIQQKQMEMQQAQQQAQQAAAQPPQEPPGMSPPQEGAGGQPALDMAQGQGFNPESGGSVPAQAAPQMTQTATRSPA